MYRGLYTAATGMLTQEIKMDLVSNNLANVNTNGYKGNAAAIKSFPQYLVHRINDTYLKVSGVEGNMDLRPLIGMTSYGAVVDEITIDFEKGLMVKTDLNTDMALEGNAFFTVQTPYGERLTRDGNFTVNSTGELVNSDGYRVLGQNGPINVNAVDALKVDEKGAIYTGDLKAPTIIDRLKVQTVDDLKTVKKVGHNLFMVQQDQPQPHAAPEFTLRQGFLEKSNVNAVTMLRNMIDVMRTYEANSKVVATEDSIMGRASDIGRVV